jgi:hypothetical protein
MFHCEIANPSEPGSSYPVIFKLKQGSQGKIIHSAFSDSCGKNEPSDNMLNVFLGGPSMAPREIDVLPEFLKRSLNRICDVPVRIGLNEDKDFLRGGAAFNLSLDCPSHRGRFCFLILKSQEMN